MVDSGFHAERLFTDLCSTTFLSGFVFHRPRYYDPTEKEAGDIALWVRREVVIFEVLVRNAPLGQGTKQFVKRIGGKRDQLARDHTVFNDPAKEIQLINEQNEVVEFDKQNIGDFGFSGIVIVDCDEPLDKLHFGTMAASLKLPFPNAIMTRLDFLDLLIEVDTIRDLTLYIADRFRFLMSVYASDPNPFLDLSSRMERNLISFYKMHENQFPVEKWVPEVSLSYYDMYLTQYRDRIEAREYENRDSYVIDEMINYMREYNSPEHPTLVHSWELAVMTRRQRARILPGKIKDAIQRMVEGNPSRHFAINNPVTGCWLVFYFVYGSDRESFRNEAERMTRRKLHVEMREKGFEFSVFGYAFRKSTLETGSSFDEILLTIEDASNYSNVSDEEYREALQYFGKGAFYEIKEFPE